MFEDIVKIKYTFFLFLAEQVVHCFYFVYFLFFLKDYGLLRYYGQYVAMNHLIKSEQLNIVKFHQQMNYPSNQNDSVDSIIHIQVSHSSGLFSELEFKSGKYDNLNLDEFNLNNVKHYALKMALDAKRLNESELTKLLQEEVFNIKL